MDNFDDAGFGLDDPELGLVNGDLPGDVELPDDFDALADPATFDALGGPAMFEVDALADSPTEVGGTLDEVVEYEYYEETLTWFEDTSPETAGVVGVSVGSALAGGARILGAAKGARDVVTATRSLGKKLG